MEIEMKPCPKCGRPGKIFIGGAGNFFTARAGCISCGLSTAIFRTMSPFDGDNEADEAVIQQARQQSADAWNSGNYLVIVEDLSINRERLAGAYQQLGSYLEEEQNMEPAERVKRWDAIRREIRDSVRLVRKEVKYGA